jgi:hypothetical protein
MWQRTCVVYTPPLYGQVPLPGGNVPAGQAANQVRLSHTVAEPYRAAVRIDRDAGQYIQGRLEMRMVLALAARRMLSAC